MTRSVPYYQSAVLSIAATYLDRGWKMILKSWPTQDAGVSPSKTGEELVLFFVMILLGQQDGRPQRADPAPECW
jgi:hypothetical protein